MGGKKNKPRHIDSSQVARAVFATADSMGLADRRSMKKGLQHVHRSCPEVMQSVKRLAQQMADNAKQVGA